jgi:hypothetical protein
MMMREKYISPDVKAVSITPAKRLLLGSTMDVGGGGYQEQGRGIRPSGKGELPEEL